MAGPAGFELLQLTEPFGLLDLPGLVRGLFAFAVVLVLGGSFLWRYRGIVERSIDASTERPLSSLGYGIAAHATLVFAAAYLTSQLGPLTVSGRSLGPLGVWLGVVLLAAAAGLGFTVVGSAVVELGWDRPRWNGLVLGAAVAGLAGVVDPLVGGLVWLIVVSTGIGGPVRAWFLASEDVESPPSG